MTSLLYFLGSGAAILADGRNPSTSIYRLSTMPDPILRVSFKSDTSIHQLSAGWLGIFHRQAGRMDGWTKLGDAILWEILKLVGGSALIGFPGLKMAGKMACQNGL